MAGKGYMIEQLEVNGIEIARVGEAIAATSPPVVLQDLVRVVNEQNSYSKGMLVSTVGKFLEFSGGTAERTPIDVLKTEMEPFLRKMQSGKYKPESVKSYRNFVNMLLKLAVASGWAARPFQVPSIWQALWDAIEADAQREILRFAIALGKKPRDLSEDDLTAWCLAQVKAGYALKRTRVVCSGFRMAILRAGLGNSIPLVKMHKPSYGVSLAKMDLVLSKEINDLIAFKVRVFDPDRPPNGRIRDVSAKNLADHLCRIVGYVQNILRNPPVTSLRELVTPDVIKGYALWAINERKIQGDSLAAGLTALRAALEQNPHYKDLNLEWLGRIAMQVPPVEQSIIDERKAKKFVSFQEADAIPASIRAARIRHKPMNARAHAISVRDELLMAWLPILPWRKENLRKCRITGGRPNIAKKPIAPFSQTKKSKWIIEREKMQPKESFWQFSFSKDETKMKNDIHAFVPFDLIALLEEYLSDHRNLLIGEAEDPETLFVTDKGGSFSEAAITERVSHLVAMHAGRATTPHLFRDIVADNWLEHHPEDYLTVSKILWHRSINTTLKKYASRFDESAGVARMDDWRASRHKAVA
jgi:integrase